MEGASMYFLFNVSERSFVQSLQDAIQEFYSEVILHIRTFFWG